jgi:hypothetical protein
MMLGLLITLWLAQEVAKPLPEPTQFLAEFRKNLHTDNLLLSQYTYTEKETSIELDSKGNAKKTEVKVYQIFPAVEAELTYRRLLSKNGVPVKAEDLNKEDREHQKRVEDFERKRRKKTPAELEEIRAKERREDDKIIDEVFGVYEVQFVARESVDGHPAIRMTFKPRPGYKPKNREGKILKHIAGTAWVSESDHELVRIEAEAIDSISIGLGLLAKLQKGARITGERRRFNDEVWLPARVEFSMNARILLLKGMNRREITEYSDHKKYNVETILTFPDIQ